MSPSWLSCWHCPSSSLKQKQWPWPQPVLLGQAQAKFAKAELKQGSLLFAPLHFLMGLCSLVLAWDRRGMRIKQKPLCLRRAEPALG